MKKIVVVAICLMALTLALSGCEDKNCEELSQEIVVTEQTMDALEEKYPEYYGLSTFKGLEVYVWQMSKDGYSFGILPGTNREKISQEIFEMKGVSAEEKRTILASYDIDEDNIIIIPIQNPISSYIADYWITIQNEDPESEAKRKKEYIDGIREMLGMTVEEVGSVDLAGGTTSPKPTEAPAIEETGETSSEAVEATIEPTQMPETTSTPTPEAAQTPQPTETPVAQTTTQPTEQPTQTPAATETPASAHVHTWTTETYYTTETVHHDAVTHTETTTIVDQEAWTETIENPGPALDLSWWNGGAEVEIQDVEVYMVDDGTTFDNVYDAAQYCNAHDPMDFHVHTFRTVIIYHPAVTHTESTTILDQAAWDETVQVPHTRQVCTGCGVTK